MNKHFVVASAIRHLAVLLTDGYSTNFFQQAAKAIASKGLSIALPLSVAGLSSATLVNELIEQLENSPLPPRLLHLDYSGRRDFRSRSKRAKTAAGGMSDRIQSGGPRSANLQLAESKYGRLPAT